ncbi:MAG TPA: tyrosine-type recombinase/integrase [Thermoleophilaceae bacterium]|nr:tyrosine-type recombinase/integrase [Thermoleophilaceae bacterium]
MALAGLALSGLGGSGPFPRRASPSSHGCSPLTSRHRFTRGEDWVFATARGTPYGHRNVSRRCRGRAAQLAKLNDDGWSPLRFHDLRHTFASHLIVDLGLDVAQISRVLGHSRITVTLDIYTHLFEDARHARDSRTRMAASPFARLLEPKTATSGATVLDIR